jgi:DNA-binding response OmpR family regulator
MRILVADDDIVCRCHLEGSLSEWGYRVVCAADGEQAWAVLRAESTPTVVILDWMMPKMSGLEFCRKVRAGPETTLTYLILLTVRDSHEDVVSGLEAGADDYITKPFHSAELLARVRVGERVVQLSSNLAERVSQLEEALAKIDRLQGLLPICAYCKRVRNDQNYWQQVEAYFSEHSQLEFSHGICPDCFEKVVKPELSRLAGNLRGKH